MAAANDVTRETACSVEVTPTEVDAGAELTLRGRASCSPAADLRGRIFLIEDDTGATVKSVELTEFEDETNATDECVVKAPVSPGTHTWSCVLAAGGNAGGSRSDTSSRFSFTVKPHDTRVLVWGVPPAIEPGEEFGIKLGAKCSSACPPEGWTVAIRDHHGKERMVATLNAEPWAGTAALYYAEVNVRAPEEEGLYSWEAEALVTGLDMPHTRSVVQFGVRVVHKPECLMTVVAVDGESRAPVAGAKVVVHPYSAWTDERGVAEVTVPKGPYRLFVSGKSYFPFRRDGTVEADTTIEAELASDSGLSDADLWS
jgi:hypothetical protein